MESAPAMALAIQIYRILMEHEHKHGRLDPAQVAYALTKDLDFHYSFYNKHGIKE